LSEGNAEHDVPVTGFADLETSEDAAGLEVEKVAVERTARARTENLRMVRP
jgi:hypothetical protein